MPKSIVILLDGTSNEIPANRTSILSPAWHGREQRPAACLLLDVARGGAHDGDWHEGTQRGLFVSCGGGGGSPQPNPINELRQKFLRHPFIYPSCLRCALGLDRFLNAGAGKPRKYSMNQLDRFIYIFVCCAAPKAESN